MKKDVSAWLVVVLPVVTALLGSGVVWNLMNYRTEQARLEIEKTRASNELRAKKIEVLTEIVKFQGNFDLRNQHHQEYRARIDQFNSLERDLARMEDRQAKEVDFEKLIPAPPRDFKIE